MPLWPLKDASPDEGAFDRLRASIDPNWIDQALELTGTVTLRRRRLPAEQVIWLVLGMALYRDRPIAELVDKLDLALPDGRDLTVARSAVAQARARLGAEPMRWLFERCSRKWANEAADDDHWRGLALYGVDGTTTRTPDSPENRAHFGGQTSGRGESGYPQARFVTLMALRSHLLAAVRFAPYAASEMALARELWSEIPDDSLTILDRAFLAASPLLALQGSGSNRHWMTRACAHTSYRVVRELGKGDALVELEVSPVARQREPDLPKKWMARAVGYQRRGFKPQMLLTSLLDAEKYPAKELAALYHERWEIELGYDEVKTEMLERREHIRSKKPAGVGQELWGLALAYNLIRLEMLRIAREARLPPNRISFVAAHRLICDEWWWSCGTQSPGAIPSHLRRLREDIERFVLPPRRSERSYPRAVKIKMSNYPRKRPIAASAIPSAK
jgi:Insertion element 4 transposase N-terminal/Transposase DDE domain